jgi:hypothetical protein
MPISSTPGLLFLQRLDRDLDALERVVVVPDACLLLLIEDVFGNNGLGLANRWGAERRVKTWSGIVILR